jgi:antitoxin component YwqK of YwqJK toxin-antitoxin module
MIQRICYLLLAAFFSYTSIAQKTRLYFDYKWQPSSAEQAAYLCDLEKNDSGWYRADYSMNTGQLLKHGYYKDADCTIKQGAFEYFFGNGEIRNTEKYVNNKKQGAYYAFYPNRMISDSFQFKNDIPYGLCSSWYPSGNPMTEMQMDTIGNGSGTVIGFFEDGTVSFKGKLAAGLRKTGNWFYYHPNGQRASVLQYGNQENNEGAIQPQIKYDDYENIYYDSTIVYNNIICYDINGIQLTDCKIVNTRPEYPGGVQGWTNYLSGQLPDMIGKSNGPKKTTTYVAYFTIYTDGTKSDPILDNTVNKEFDKEIIGLLKRSRKWKPAFHNNRIVPFLNRQSLTLLRTF